MAARQWIFHNSLSAKTILLFHLICAVVLGCVVAQHFVSAECTDQKNLINPENFSRLLSIEDDPQKPDDPSKVRSTLQPVALDASYCEDGVTFRVDASVSAQTPLTQVETPLCEAAVTSDPSNQKAYPWFTAQMLIEEGPVQLELSQLPQIVSANMLLVTQSFPCIRSSQELRILSEMKFDVSVKATLRAYVTNQRSLLTIHESIGRTATLNAASQMFSIKQASSVGCDTPCAYHYICLWLQKREELMNSSLVQYSAPQFQSQELCSQDLQVVSTQEFKIMYHIQGVAQVLMGAKDLCLRSLPLLQNVKTYAVAVRKGSVVIVTPKSTLKTSPNEQRYMLITGQTVFAPEHLPSALVTLRILFFDGDEKLVALHSVDLLHQVVMGRECTPTEQTISQNSEVICWYLLTFGVPATAHHAQLVITAQLTEVPKLNGSKRFDDFPLRVQNLVATIYYVESSMSGKSLFTDSSQHGFPAWAILILVVAGLLLLMGLWAMYDIWRKSTFFANLEIGNSSMYLSELTPNEHTRG